MKEFHLRNCPEISIQFKHKTAQDRAQFFCTVQYLYLYRTCTVKYSTAEIIECSRTSPGQCILHFCPVGYLFVRYLLVANAGPSPHCLFTIVPILGC